MNRQESDILLTLTSHSYITQRILAKSCGYSLGIINRSLKSLIEQGYIDQTASPTPKAKKEIYKKSPRNAVILAAGFGMRMVPIHTETPKGLLEINGEPLIERIIKQLHEVGIKEIYIVVGFMKERYEYLIDDYQVKLITNSEYAVKNNMYSLKKAAGYLSNTYIIPCDIWCAQNPFRQHELYSWYMISDLISPESNIHFNRKFELVVSSNSSGGNSMIGIAYLLREQSEAIRLKLDQLCQDSRYDNAFWETTLFQNNKMIVSARLVHSTDFIEINTYEQLRELDCNSCQLRSDAITIIANALKVKASSIQNISILKKGMTNRSFSFECRNQKYIMRIPGEGTSQLIDRTHEAMVYQVINGKGICDDNIYINPKNGYKITRFIEGSRVCNPFNREDVIKCMEKLRSFHNMHLVVEHDFDIFEQINFYESLWQEEKSVYRDYFTTKEKVFSLRHYISSHVAERALTHIDAVPDNFLFYTDEQGNEVLRLIDWEYAGMQDPHVDIAMFCIYSLYSREQVDDLIQIYFAQNCPDETRIKIYCYIASCGLLWSNWCEYKRTLGVDFGEYSLRQYRYAKEYYRIVYDMLGKEREKWDIK